MLHVAQTRSTMHDVIQVRGMCGLLRHCFFKLKHYVWLGSRTQVRSLTKIKPVETRLKEDIQHTRLETELKRKNAGKCEIPTVVVC